MFGYSVGVVGVVWVYMGSVCRQCVCREGSVLTEASALCCNCVAIVICVADIGDSG